MLNSKQNHNLELSRVPGQQRKCIPGRVQLEGNKEVAQPFADKERIAQLDRLSLVA
jgi:hypothetical protein